jgi:hypothetical protein
MDLLARRRTPEPAKPSAPPGTQLSAFGDRCPQPSRCRLYRTVERDDLMRKLRGGGRTMSVSEQKPTIRDAIRLADKAAASPDPEAYVEDSRAAPETKSKAVDILKARRSPRGVL